MGSDASINKKGNYLCYSYSTLAEYSWASSILGDGGKGAAIFYMCDMSSFLEMRSNKMSSELPRNAGYKGETLQNLTQTDAGVLTFMSPAMSKSGRLAMVLQESYEPSERA